MSLRASTLVAALTVIATTPVFDSDRGDVLAIVKQFSNDFSANRMKDGVSLCTDHAVIIDDFAPHMWQGANACSDWWNAFLADNEKNGITDGSVRLGEPWHITVATDRAYAVLPLTYTFKHKRTLTVSQGVWTFALQKLPVGWRIGGLAFALH